MRSRRTWSSARAVPQVATARSSGPLDDRDQRRYDGPPDDPEREWDGWDDGRGSGAGTVRGAGRGTSTPEFRPGLEALRLAIHRPEEVGDRLHAELFGDPVQRAAFTALVEADDLGVAIDSAPGRVQDMLVRLTVEVPRSEPDEVVVQLVRDAVRRELPQLTVEARTSDQAKAEIAQVAVWLQELDDPDAAAEASRRLVAWFLVRARTDGSGQGT